MKTSLRAAALAAAWIATACAFAAPQAAVDSGNDRVRITAPTYKLAPQEFNDYAYSYILNNGKRITFTQRVAHYYTQLQGEPRMEIFARSPGVFLTADGARMEFREEGEVVAINNYERLVTSVKLPDNTAMMAGR
jgi:hypothetical protein